MPKFLTTCVSFDPDHPQRAKNRMYAALYYAKHGQTEKYKESKRQERIRRRAYLHACKVLSTAGSSDATTARSEICCDAEPCQNS